jgi:predicted Fe-Mo cluster-binding NifX family protein
MKIVLSATGGSWNDSVDPRLGRAQGLAIYDEQSKELSYISNADGASAEHGAGLQVAKLILDSHADVIITGNGPGSKAGELLAKSNIKIYVGAGDMSLEDAYNAYKNEKLTQL